MLTKSSLKTEYSRLYPAIALRKNLKKRHLPLPPLPLTWLQPSKSSWPLRRELPPHLARTFGARGSSSSQRQKRDPLAWNCCILPYLLCLLPQWRLNAFYSTCGQFYTSIRSSLFAETIDMLVFTKYFLLRHKDNKFLDI